MLNKSLATAFIFFFKFFTQQPESRILQDNEWFLTYIFIIWGSVTDPPSQLAVPNGHEWKADFSPNSGPTVQQRAEALWNCAHSCLTPPPALREPQWRTHSWVGHGQRGPSRYLRVENRANTQGQYRHVTKGLCAKYHWGCVCVQVCHSFHWTCIHYSIQINRK